jgi:hypothetical protein
MNNEQFRNLLAKKTPDSQNATASASKSMAPPAMLGSRKTSSIPMTPRSVMGRGGVDFARQLAERNAGPQKAKKFRSAAPKGSRLAAGFTDRTQERVDEEADDKARRIKALEEAMKLQQIDEETFTRLRDEITGGDISSTHLVKGLDFRLLARVKAGENVLEEAPKPVEEDTEPVADLDDEFELLEKKEVAPVAKEETVKKGMMAPPPPVAGQKRSRDQILAELKASRKAAAEAKKAAMPKLGDKFKKIGQATETSRIERDEKGREVLITVDADGNIKRKVRKVKHDEQVEGPAPLLELDPTAKPLGMEVPDVPPPPPPEEEEEDEDIFDGVGHDFNPLAGFDEDASSSDDEPAGKPVPEPLSPMRGQETRDERLRSRSRSRSNSASGSRSSSAGSGVGEPNPEVSLSTATPTVSSAPRNYFNDDPSTLSVLGNITNPLKDPAFLASLAASRKLDPVKMSEDSAPKSAEEEARLKRRAAMISNQDRDLEDMDMGFGSSRFDDAEEMANEGAKVKLSQWKGLGKGEEDDDDEDGGKKGKGDKKRKRAPKKRKGDKDSAADVLSIMKSNKTKAEAKSKPIG